MRIAGRRVRRLERHLPTVAAGTEVVPAVVEVHRHQERLSAMGFSAPPVIGESLLPPVAGPRTRENANGSEIVHRDQPMEQAWVDSLYRWLEWHGKESHEQWGVRSRPYWRYPRTRIAPQDVQFTALEQASALWPSPPSGSSTAPGCRTGSCMPSTSCSRCSASARS